MQKVKTLEKDQSRSIIAVLSVLLVPALLLAFVRGNEAMKMQQQIESMYEKAFYEVCELTEGLAVNYAKLAVTGESAHTQTLLNDICRQSQGALSGLAMLPLGDETVSATIKFMNQAGDFAESVSVKLAAGGSITEEDHAAMQTISASATGFSESMNTLLQRYANGEVVFDGHDMQATGDETLYPLTGAAGEFPTLIYDGPFADIERGGTYKALEGAYVISPEEAQGRLAAFLQTDNLPVYEGESELQVKCYEFLVDMGRYTVNAGVTQQGGHTLYMISNASVQQPVLSDARCVELAQRFLENSGYGNVKMSYYSKFDGIITINFAPLQGDVVLYPDLIKVQLETEQGNVVGLEAHGYLQNHVTRLLPEPELTPEQAMAKLSAVLEPHGAQLCLIPLNGNEYLCYEITASSAMGMFMVYIDAQTGDQREILQVVDSETGTLVM